MYKELIPSILVVALLNLVGCYSYNNFSICPFVFEIITLFQIQVLNKSELYNLRKVVL